MIFLNTFKNFYKDAKFKKKNHGSNIINVKVVKDRLERTNRFSSIEFFTEIPVSSVITQHHPLIQAYRLEYRHGCLIFAFTPSLLNVLFLSFFLSQNSSAFIVSKIVNQIITSSNRIYRWLQSRLSFSFDRSSSPDSFLDSFFRLIIT